MIAMSSFNDPSDGREDGTDASHLFIQVHPQTSTSTPKPLRTMVRKHVMSQLSRDRCNESPEEVVPSSTKSEPGAMRKQITRFRLKKNHQSGRKLHPIVPKEPNLNLHPPRNTRWQPSLSCESPFLERLQPQDSVSTYRRNPFISYPIDTDDEAQSLFTFYLTELNSKSDSRLLHRDFIPIALSDAACFHILLATLLQFQRFQGRPNGPCFWYHRGAAIVALNQAVSYQCPKITDAMFYTVCMLLYVESRIPDMRSQTANLHILALIKFLELRRGKLNVELCCMLVRLSIWCSFHPPLAKPPVVALKQLQPFDFGLNLPGNEKNFTPIPIDIFDDLKFLVRLSTELGCKQMPDDEDERRNSVYQRFVSQCLVRASKSLLTLPTATPAELNAVRCIQLAKILFSYIICPSMSVSGIYCRSIVVALRACLEAGCDESEDAVRWPPEVLCWILVTGAVTKQVKALQLWYLNRVADFIQHQRIQTFDEFAVLLRKVVWAGNEFGSACKSLWMESLAAQVLDE